LKQVDGGDDDDREYDACQELNIEYYD